MPVYDDEEILHGTIRYVVNEDYINLYVTQGRRVILDRQERVLTELGRWLEYYDFHEPRETARMVLEDISFVRRVMGRVSSPQRANAERTGARA